MKIGNKSCHDRTRLSVCLFLSVCSKFEPLYARLHIHAEYIQARRSSRDGDESERSKPLRLSDFSCLSSRYHSPPILNAIHNSVTIFLCEYYVNIFPPSSPLGDEDDGREWLFPTRYLLHQLTRRRWEKQRQLQQYRCYIINGLLISAESRQSTVKGRGGMKREEETEIVVVYDRESWKRTQHNR